MGILLSASRHRQENDFRSWLYATQLRRIDVLGQCLMIGSMRKHPKMASEESFFLWGLEIAGVGFVFGGARFLS